MKQPPDLKLLQTIRLLRYARNDIKRGFLRDHQYFLSGMMVSCNRENALAEFGRSLPCQEEFYQQPNSRFSQDPLLHYSIIPISERSGAKSIV